jgi:hypothetical protein
MITHETSSIAAGGFLAMCADARIVQFTPTELR